MANTSQQEFYKEIDRDRHRSGCLPVFVIALLVLGALAVVVWYVRSGHSF